MPTTWKQLLLMTLEGITFLVFIAMLLGLVTFACVAIHGNACQ